MFELTISVDDVDRFVAEPGHQGSAEGYVDSDLLGGRLDVERGWFNLFVQDDDPDQRQMLYRLWLRGPGGNPMTFTGVKEVRDEAGLDVWRDTSTLYVKILDGHHEPGDDDAPVLAAGVITIHIPDFMKQLTTFRTWGDSRVGAMEGFGRLFLGQLWDVYGRFFRDGDDGRRQEARVKRAELAEHFVELNFMPQDACRWLSPSELRTFAAQTLSMIFGNYADKRELQKVFDSNLIVMPPADQPLPEGADFWFDYTADVGDGFEATYTVAALLGQPSLRVEGLDTELPRGQMLVLGGDQVYPTASSKAYEDRTTGPYRSAMPEATPQPLMLALPGNHDWYDGLTAFLRLFTQDRMIGGWRTEQKRSYFTVQLPHRWWLVGLDSQLDTYFDDPQLKYFEETLTANLQPGDSVIVCCATPAWVKAWSDTPTPSTGWSGSSATSSARGGSRAERLEPTGAQARLWLSGDKHHYIRYEERLADPAAPEGTARQMVTAGIGGAYLDVTHGMATEVKLLPQASRNWREGDNDATFVQQPVTYPSLEDSRAWVSRLAQPWRKEWIVRRNPGVFTALRDDALHPVPAAPADLLAGDPGLRDRAIIDAYLSATPRELFRFTGGLLAVVLSPFAICLLPMVRRRPPLLSIKAMMLILSQLATACACFVGFGLLPSAPSVSWPPGSSSSS